ncbi:MAG: flagellar protein FlbB [Spirochaetes bacterium]|nr:flagellar protein FlbB [Spirochaetota bacterium]
MRLTSDAGAGLRIFVLILLIIVLFIGGMVWFDHLGIISARERIGWFYTALLGQRGLDIEDRDDLFLLEQVRFTMMKEALGIREEELNRRNEELDNRDVEIRQRIEILNEREKAFAERENSFNQRTRLYENRIANLEQNSRDLTGMPPERAVNILLNKNDQDIIDVMRVTERISQEAGEMSLVAFWLSLMPPERAAAIQRKMSIRPNGLGA